MNENAETRGPNPEEAQQGILPLPSGRLFWIALGYYLAVHAGFSSLVKPEGITALWPATGVLLGVLLTHDRRHWPRILLACVPMDFAANLVFNGGDIAFSLVASLVDALGPVAAALTIRLVLRRELRLDNLLEWLFLILLVLPSLALTSFAGSAVAVAWGMTPAAETRTVYRFLSLAIGILLLTPVLLYSQSEHWRRIRRLRWAGRIELGASIVLVALFACWIFISPQELRRPYRLPLPYLLFPPVVWLCLRFNPLVSSAASAAIGLGAGWFTSQGLGPFAAMTDSDGQRVVLAQAFSATIAVTALVLGTILAQRRGAEEALRRSEERLDLALQGADLGMWDWSIREGVVLFGDEWISRLGYAPSDVDARVSSLRDLVHPEDLAALSQAIRDNLDGKTPSFESEFRFRSKSGAWTWLRIRGRVVERDETSRPVRAAGTIHDLSPHKREEEERRRLREQFLQAQKMESVGRLAGGVAHDLGNLLTPIIGYTEMALWTIDPKDPLYANLEQVVQAGNKAKDMTRRLLTFGRKQTPEMAPVDPNRLVSGLSRILRRIIREDIEVKLELESRPVLIRADAAQIEQVLMNLAVNAQDAMPERGRLTIRTALEPCPESLPQTENESCLLLEVKDNGAGMDEETRSHLFEPFFTTKERGKGTGLGLATAYDIVNEHGGAITVRSAPGEGSVFAVYLPLCPAAVAESQPPSPPEPAPPGCGTILVIDDEAAVRSLVCRLLSQLGYQVIEAGRPQDALEISEAYAAPIDLLISDVVMPQMNGRALYLKLTERRPRLKVLYMSGYSGSTMADESLLEEGTHLIHKPFAIGTLTQKVRELLASEPAG